MEAIIRFAEPYQFLSNFHPCKVVFGANLYPTLEHAYQAAKTDNTVERARILEAWTPGRAKRLGQKVTLRPDWEQVKVSVMLDLLREKFAAPELAQALLLTGDALLVEGNTWHDSEWGVCTCSRCPGVGDNFLGGLLMQVREELRRKEV